MLQVSRFAALLSSVAFLATAATAQTGSYAEQLVSGSTSIAPLRSIDTTTRADKRYAVVIGNSAYAAIPSLPNARADADVMAEFLRSQDYIVHHHADITKRGFEDVLRRILFDVDKDTEVVIFFAGHGFQIGAENYLVPIDADLDTVYDIPFEAVSLGSLVSIVGARARLQVVILDSCRDNPFVGKAAMTQIGSSLRETKTGFASLSAPLNSMLMYSTSPGALAFDGEGDNSPFTAALVSQASEAPDSEIKDVFEGVRRQVYQATNGRQIPWDSSTLIEPASFGIGAALMRPLPVSSSGTGVTRGLARISPEGPETLVQVADQAGISNVIDADFVPQVEIGPALTAALDLGPADNITVAEGPETGRLVLPLPDGRMTDVIGQTLLPDEVDRLVMVNTSVQVPALTLADGVLMDALSITVAGRERRIAIRLQPNPCDFHAGDHLDPDGMGITRYPNELKPEIALSVCEDEIAKTPETARYHYQMGRALMALKDLDGAEAAFDQARLLGHSRAWYALGLVAGTKARAEGRVIDGKLPEDVLTFYARGVDEGDPYAFYALGRQLMRYAGTDAREVEGFDLVSRSLEVGHTFAMNDLASFYLNPDNDYFDGERGLRYLRESASRSDIYGYNSLGLAYFRGRAGLDVDDAKAYGLFRQASDNGHPTAPFNIARMYRDGRAPEGADVNRAIEWFAEGLSRGHARSGSNAAHLIMSQGASNYDAFDAAIFAAKGAALTGNRYAGEARELLNLFAPQQLDGATQRLIVELGGEITVDGAFGPSSEAALQAVLDQYDFGSAEVEPKARLLQLASLSWQTNPFRVDLY
ncbi:MAG: caspase family protein [Pseudomonadota bacterium]